MVGLSDHTMGTIVSTTGVALGAALIEKHFTLSRDEGGPDAAFSMEPEELRSLVVESKRAYKAIGKVSYAISVKEKNSAMFRPSIWTAKDLKSGDILSQDNLIIRRPGNGLPPKLYNDLIGKKLVKDISYGQILSKDSIIN